MAAKIPQLGKKSKTLKKENYLNQTAVYKGQADFHSMLKKILKHTKGKSKTRKGSKRTQAKKTTIFRHEKSRISKKVLTLYTEMREKTHNKEGITTSSEDTKKVVAAKDNIKNTGKKLKTISRVKRSELSESQDDTVRSIVRQTIEEKHDTKPQNGAHLSYVIQNAKEDTQMPHFTHDTNDDEDRDDIRRSEIPKPEKSRIETILESLSKAFGYS